jgi:phospholipase/carboxylesterase
MNLSLEYLIREPKTICDKNPLLLLLHGYGSNASDLFSFATELPEKYYVVSAQAPHELMMQAYCWYAINFDADQNKFSDNVQAAESRDLIVKFIDELIQHYAIDPDDVSLLGFSQGSILSYSIGLSYPEKIKNIVAFSGYVNQDILCKDFHNNNLQKLNIFHSHGTADQVIPIDWAREVKPFLEQNHIQSSYKEYPMGHQIIAQNFFDFIDWLDEH